MKAIDPILRYGCLFLALAPVYAQVPGSTLAPWSPGMLDIHRISTGKGDAVLYIFPDGTTLLADPGSTSRQGPRNLPQRPDSSRTPGEWVVRYLKRVLPAAGGSGAIDYALITHFHGDHMGDVLSDSKAAADGKYKLTGITEVGDAIPIRTLLDRNWPKYDYPQAVTGPMMSNYRAFIEAQSAKNGLRAEQFVPGRKDQIVLKRDPAKYPTFVVQNVAANGEIWTGVGDVTKKHFPPVAETPQRDRPSENMCSIAFRLSYGKFDYFAGGDMPGIPDEGGAPDWHDVETPVARAVGPVDVAVLNHHGSLDSENAFFLSTLRPRVQVFSVWSPGQPAPRVWQRLMSTRIYPGPRDIFATNMHDAVKIVIADLNKLKSEHGHIVIRVEPGGSTYKVIILDDTSETGRITAVHGPYESQ